MEKNLEITDKEKRKEFSNGLKKRAESFIKKSEEINGEEPFVSYRLIARSRFLNSFDGTILGYDTINIKNMEKALQDTRNISPLTDLDYNKCVDVITKEFKNIVVTGRSNNAAQHGI